MDTPNTPEELLKADPEEEELYFANYLGYDLLVAPRGQFVSGRLTIEDRSKMEFVARRVALYGTF